MCGPKLLVCQVDDFRQARFGFFVVDAVHQQNGIRFRPRLQQVDGFLDLLQRQLGVEAHLRGVAPVDGVAQVRDVVVAIRHPDRGHGGAVGRFPGELGAQALALFSQPAPEKGAIDPEAAQDLRELGDVPEAVGHVANFADPAVAFADLVSELQVADQGFRADQELVRQDVPGSNLEPALPAEPLELRLALRADFQVVFEDRHLPIEHEHAVLRVVV